MTQRGGCCGHPRKRKREEYFEELAALLTRTNSQPSESEMEDLRERYDTEQITPLHDH